MTSVGNSANLSPMSHFTVRDLVPGDLIIHVLNKYLVLEPASRNPRMAGNIWTCSALSLRDNKKVKLDWMVAEVVGGKVYRDGILISPGYNIT